MDDRFEQNGKVSRGGKRALEGAFFLLVMGLSFYTVFHGQDKDQVIAALRRLSPVSLGLAILTGLFFVSAEGMMIC